jgi:hypothetical protein
MVRSLGNLCRGLALLVFSAACACAQISPGPLSHQHQSFEGATKCATCHNFGVGVRSLKCLDCHVEIRRRVEEHTGYHARAYNISPSQIDCARCHAEHNGRQFPLTKLDRKKFDHLGLTGFALEGKHSPLSCEQCHAAKHIGVAARAEIKMKDINQSFLGLGKECQSCHQDPHAGQLGAECLRCHNQDAWKPAEGFQHFRTAFPLTGLHQNVTCVKCHGPKPGETAARYKGLAFANCQNCHTDPHRGAFQDASFQGSCQNCHSTAGWKAILPTAGFDHQKTKFPLNGKHAETVCSQCHKNNDFRTPVAHALCGDCHQDIHHGQFAGRAAGADCNACHNETKFKPALYTRETHQQSAFKLEGKHFKLECEKCHQPAGKEAAYKIRKLICVDCHADPHGGEFQAAPYNNRCEQCHTQESFRPATFDLSRHSKSKFVLVNAHSAVLCADCHKPLANVTAVSVTALKVSAAAAPVPRQYHFADQTCTGCHTDPHATKLTCETCHNTRHWKELRTFDHASTKFGLEGAHQNATCIGCHKPATAAATATAGKATADFSHTPKQCFECHEDIHGGQFMAPGKEKDCSSCHTISKWSAGSFDHNKTDYPLDGAHSRVRCVQCHTQQKELDARVIRLYRGTPKKCDECHGANNLAPNGTKRAQ